MTDADIPDDVLAESRRRALLRAPPAAAVVGSPKPGLPRQTAERFEATAEPRRTSHR